MDWQPIETAPKDGTEILAVGEDYGRKEAGLHYTVVSFINGQWKTYEDDGDVYVFLTHWMPLPPPPGGE